MIVIPRALVHLRSASQPDTSRPTELDIPTTEIRKEASENDKPDWTASWKYKVSDRSCSRGQAQNVPLSDLTKKENAKTLCFL